MPAADLQLQDAGQHAGQEEYFLQRPCRLPPPLYWPQHSTWNAAASEDCLLLGHARIPTLLLHFSISRRSIFSPSCSRQKILGSHDACSQQLSATTSQTSARYPISRRAFSFQGCPSLGKAVVVFHTYRKYGRYQAILHVSQIFLGQAQRTPHPAMPCRLIGAVLHSEGFVVTRGKKNSELH